MIRSIVFFIGAVCLTACETKSLDYYTVVESTKAIDFKVPYFIFKDIENKIKAEGHKDKPVYKRADAAIILKSEDQNVLKNPALHITLPAAHGHLNLSKYVVGNGRFTFHFDEKKTEGLPKLESLYFLSQAPQVKVASDIYGVGCHKVVDYTDQIKTFFSNKGVELVTDNGQHFSLLVGDYIMVFRDKNIVYLAHVQIRANPTDIDQCDGDKAT